MLREDLTREVQSRLGTLGDEAVVPDEGFRDQTLEVAGQLLGRGMRQDALELLSRLGRVFPDHAGIRHVAGLALMAMHRLADAETCFHQALSLEPDLLDVYVDLAELYRAQHEDRRANDCLRTYLRLHKKKEGERESRVHTSLGWLQCVKGNEDEAVPHFQEALQKGADSPQTFLELRLAAHHLKERNVPDSSEFVAMVEELETSVRKEGGRVR